MYKDRAKNLVRNSVNLPYCCNTNYLFPEHYKIGKVKPPAWNVTDVVDTTDIVDVADTTDVADAADMADVVDAADMAGIADAADVADAADIAGMSDAVDVADMVDAVNAVDVVKGGLGIWERNISCFVVA